MCVLASDQARPGRRDREKGNQRLGFRTVLE
jgi:hypothetical protein